MRASAHILRFAEMVAAVSEDLSDSVVAAGLRPERVEVTPAQLGAAGADPAAVDSAVVVAEHSSPTHHLE